jgi:two-component system, OmpR family, response regulator
MGSKVRILIVEDDKTIASFIAKGLKQAGYKADIARDGVSGLERVFRSAYDAAVMDIMLPRKNGIHVVGEMRDRGLMTPVILLSEKRTVDDCVRGLQAGGDDYLAKPFSFLELIARLQALVRRANRMSQITRLTVADLTMDLVEHHVDRGGESIVLLRREWILLELLMRRPGRMVSKTMILENVWDYDFDPQTNVVDVLVCRLRNKIDRSHPVKLLHTIRGMGYVLRPPRSSGVPSITKT